MTDATPRFALPLLSAGQAQKEVLHNEALALLDWLAGPAVETAGLSDPPLAPLPGQAWIVGAGPTGAWAGQADTLALWTDGGWRFVAPVDGLAVWRQDAGCWAVRVAGAWVLNSFPVPALSINGKVVVGPQAAAIADPAGGAVVDPQARDAVAAILAALRGHGLIAA